MTDPFVPSDTVILDLLRDRGALTVSQLAQAVEVTATAVRQRLARLMAQGYIERAATPSGRGRPRHHYRLTAKGRRRAGENFADLAMVLWQEIRTIADADVRRGLLERLSQRLAAVYAEQIEGETIEQKMAALAELFAERRVPFEVDCTQELPVLTAVACPYPELAEQDRGICAMERMMFSELLGQKTRLTQCRLDGQSCCTFELAPSATT